ncbi:MAG: protease inhibitor I42 family protein [Anaerolineales bacterium]|nr:protease inhibitor I42 family protein [Anaerolineales bacterium]
MADKLLRTSVLMGALIFFMFMAGCGSGGLTVGENRNGGVIELHRGETVTVSLDSNPTTGYGWTVREIDSSILEQQGDVTYTQSPAAEGQVGVGGKEAYRFEAVGKGQTTLVLEYQRSWEAGVAPLQTYTLTVLVR